MSFWTVVLIIAAMMIFGAVIKSRYNAKLGYATDENGKPIGPSPREREMETELQELRERVKVLERIATEDREAKRLSSEIEQLRDE